MNKFYCTLVTVKHGNVIGDLVGIVIEDSEGVKSAISINEAEALVADKQIEDLILEPGTMRNAEGVVIQTFNFIFFADGKPLMCANNMWYKDVMKDESISFSDEVREAISDSPYA